MHGSQAGCFQSACRHKNRGEDAGYCWHAYERVEELEAPACVHRGAPEVSVASAAAEAELEMNGVAGRLWALNSNSAAEVSESFLQRNFSWEVCSTRGLIISSTSTDELDSSSP